MPERHQSSAARLLRLLDANPAVTYICEPTGEYAATYVSRGIEALTGHQPERYTEDAAFWANHIHPEDRVRVFADLKQLFERDHHVHEYRFQHRDGHYLWMRDQLNLVRSADGVPEEIVGFWEDVTARKKAEELLHKAYEEVARLAVYDELTGLYNRRELMNRLAQEVQRSQRYQHLISLLILDLDHFKALNDAHGHPAGDEALRRVGLTISECVRPVDMAARYGGEEFGIILPETNIDDAMVVGERVRNSIASLSIPVAPETTVNLTASIGIAIFPDHGDSKKTLISVADSALYEAKRMGRNRVCVGYAHHKRG